MKRKAKIFKMIAVVFLCVAMLVSSFNINIDLARGIYLAKDTSASAAELDTSAPDNIQDGTILQAFCWSFNAIKENMADIAVAGYAAVQTSPIQECLSTFPDMTIGGNGHWYYHYQPTDYTIGNYQVGTEEEFIEMCDVAESYNIKIIVDAVPNHTTVDRTQVSENLLNAVGGEANLYHKDTGLVNSSNYSDRLECTRNAIGNLPDIDTENTAFQDYFISFLNQCIADGADGFRYDSAKHIGAPDDPRPEGIVNNFWERVTTDITYADSIFNYGEVLQGANDRLPAFEDAIGATTASDYGANIRTALANNNYMVSNISGYMVDGTVDPDNLVTWVESHDNYYNDGTWSRLDNSHIILGWAMVTARANATPLFFSRPYGSSTTNEYGTNTIGIAGDDTYKDDQVAAVNKFRNAMVGESENLTNPEGNTKVLMIERGSEGIVIVNGNYSNYALDTETNLVDGTYINRTDDNSVFTVINGKISGVLPARSAIVLYGAEATNSTTVHFYNGDNWGTVYSFVSGSEVLGAYPGTLATKDGDGWWRVTVPADVADGFAISFNDGADNQTSTFTVNDGTKLYYTSSDDTAYATKAAAEAAIGIVKTTVYFFNSGSWSNVCAYAWGTSEVLGGWPGVEAKSDGDGWWSVDIPAAPSAGLNVIFNDNVESQTGSIVIDNSTDVYLTNDSATKYTSKLEAQTAIEYDPNAVTVYFYNNPGWSEVSAYAWGGGNLGDWPGTAATDAGGNWWKITIPSPPSMNLNVIFNNNNQGSQTGSIIISNITNRYTCAVNTTAYPSKAALLAAHGFDSMETNVYFYNYSHWDNVYASVNKDGELLEAYPGTLATEQANNWWRVTIPSGVSDNLNVTFNDGSSENKSDIFTVNNQNSVYYTGANNTAYQSKIAAETALDVEKSTIKVCFYNSSDWAAVGAYVYGPGELLGAWPGTETTEEGNGWSSIIIPYSESTGLHVIFNSNGSGNQSSDFIIDDATNTYVTNFSNEKYTSKAAAEEDNGVIHTTTLVSVVTPSAITGLPNNTAKTAEALTLPSTVKLTTNDGEVTANVTWDLNECTYVSTSTASQSFTVNGTITLPGGVVNPNSVSVVTTISVSVKATSVIPAPNPGTETPSLPSKPDGDLLKIEVPLENGNKLPTENIIEKIAKTDSSEVNLSVQFTDNTSNTGLILTNEILNAAKEANKILSVTVKDEKDNELYTWSFDKDALNSSNNDMTDVDLTLDVETISDEETLGNALDGTGLVISFAYEGLLPAQASVKVYVGNIDGVVAGSKVYLYHYNQETGMLETLPYSSDYIVDAEGYITFSIVHCSDYMALTQQAPAEMVTSIRNQIKVSPLKKTLYVGGTAQSSTNIKIELPATLVRVNSLTDKTSQSAIGAVTVSYSSSNSKVAIVLANGKIKAVGEGSAIITTTMTLYSGKVKTVETVIKVKKPSITLTSFTSSMKVGSEFTFTAEVYGLNKADIIWTTSKKSIVIIKIDGVATAKSKGTDYVIAKIGDIVRKIRVVVE